jgi:hypothetical protein
MTLLPSPVPRGGKTHYSEQEAAIELGLSLPELRSLLRSHIVECEEDMHNTPTACFQPSDLLILKLLAANRVRA